MNASDDLASLRAELSQLRKDTAQLRKEMNDLRRFITIEYEDEETGGDRTRATGINLRCGALFFHHPTEPNRPQMFLAAGAEDQGPCISIWGSDQKARIILTVEKDEPRIALKTREFKDAVLLHADPASGLGLIAAFENGLPRALIKAGPDSSGAVAVVHDDGRTRACLRSTATAGEIFVATPDLKTAIKLTSHSHHGGGTLTVHDQNGKPAIILGTVQGYGGSIILNDPEGIPYATLPDAKKMQGEDEDGD